MISAPFLSAKRGDSANIRTNCYEYSSTFEKMTNILSQSQTIIEKDIIKYENVMFASEYNGQTGRMEK